MVYSELSTCSLSEGKAGYSELKDKRKNTFSNSKDFTVVILTI
jgi:hypothetical protein